jgi:EAL domain-containing protein (putative c-di-GMP-specific phosphodiesterase class I)
MYRCLSYRLGGAYNHPRRKIVGREILLKKEIKTAMEEKQFVLHYQPQIEIASGRLVGAEALLRWQHPSLGTLTPASFISVAEEIRIINSIGQWATHEACRQAVFWQTQSHIDTTISVNVSAGLIAQRDFVEQIRNTLTDTGLQPELLELEITESMLVEDFDLVKETLNLIRNLGVRIALDDFGTGFSNLMYLSQFPIDTLKIDQHFVLNLGERNRLIIQSVIELAQKLHLRTIAEGVETLNQAEFLLGTGCQLAQGYYFSSPLPPDAYAKYAIKASETKPLRGHRH